MLKLLLLTCPTADQALNIDRFSSILAQAELTRATAFKREQDRQCFLFGRTLLRQFVAKNSGPATDPGKIDIRYGKYGNPYLYEQKIYFNISHTNNLVLLGLSGDYPIGVDIERITDLSDIDDVASQYFHEKERHILSQATVDHKATIFCKIWCRKEAFSKALGLGLYLPPESYAILPAHTGILQPLLSEKALKLLSEPAPLPPSWQIYDLIPAPGYAAAVAINSQNGVPKIEYLDWREIL